MLISQTRPYMLLRISPLRLSRPSTPLAASLMAARVLSRACPTLVSFLSSYSHSAPPKSNGFSVSYSSKPVFSERRFHSFSRNNNRATARYLGRVLASRKEYRKVRRRRAAKSSKDLALNVSVCIEDGLPDDHEVLVPLCFHVLGLFVKLSKCIFLIELLCSHLL